MHLSRIKELVNRYYGDPNQVNKANQQNQGMPGLFVFRREALSDIEAFVYEPVLCLVLQGSKVTSVGDQLVNLTPGDALLVSHELPVVSRITKASTQEPYLALILPLDLQLVRSLYDQVADAPVSWPSVRSMSMGPADVAWLEPLVRYLEMTGNPADAKVLGPLTLREIYYRLLLSPVGAMLRKLLFADSHASRVAKAISQLRADYRLPLKVPHLAKTAAMSESSFHGHFKAVTGTTPLQYQKDLRLIEAQSLLRAMRHTVSEAAYAVGYESPNHFSRDYSRKFGLPPSKGAAVEA
jgi:AraC-like DNA-binding protein